MATFAPPFSVREMLVWGIPRRHVIAEGSKRERKNEKFAKLTADFYPLLIGCEMTIR